jgi:hypothetical protein
VALGCKKEDETRQGKRKGRAQAGWEKERATGKDQQAGPVRDWAGLGFPFSFPFFFFPNKPKLFEFK